MVICIVSRIRLNKIAKEQSIAHSLPLAPVPDPKIAKPQHKECWVQLDK